jgi:hypothetical protein
MNAKHIRAMLIAACVVSTATVWADWSSAESEDFALDTTIPEPTALVIVIVCIAGAARREIR